MSADAWPYPDETALLQGVVHRRPDAVRRFLDEVAPVVYGYVFARVGGDQATAEDLVQDTLLEAVRSADTFRGDSALSTWMCAIARRRLARYYETERRAEAARRGLHLMGAAAERPEDDLERRDEVVRALGHLAPAQRQALVLKYLDGYSVDQVARALGRSPVQTQSLLQRGREALRRHLEDACDG